MAIKEIPAEPGLRLDVCLLRAVEGVNRGFIKQLIERGQVKVDGREKAAGYKLREGEKIRLDWPEPVAAPKLPILFEDKDLVVVDKPLGLIVHPAGETWLTNPETSLSEKEPSIVSWILTERPPKPGLERCGLVHRLDRETSGVLCIAKSPAGQSELLTAFKDRRVEKVYLAVVKGKLPKPQGSIEAPVGRVKRRLVATPYGRKAQSGYKVLKEGRSASLVEVRPLTGRTHQIRVHLAHIGNPVLGDKDHGGPPAERLFLHAHRLRFKHKGKALEIVSPAPKEFLKP